MSRNQKYYWIAFVSLFLTSCAPQVELTSSWSNKTAQVKKSAKVEQVIISEQIDKSVIGGVRIDTAAHSWDKTLSRKLTDIQEVI